MSRRTVLRRPARNLYASPTTRPQDKDLPTHGVTAKELALIAGVHITTARRWKRNPDALPARAEKALRALSGELGAIDPAFKGWRLIRGEIVSPEGWSFRPGEVRAIPFHRQQIAELRTRLRFDVQADWIQGAFTRPPENTDTTSREDEQ